METDDGDGKILGEAFGVYIDLLVCHFFISLKTIFFYLPAGKAGIMAQNLEQAVANFLVKGIVHGMNT